MTHIRNRNDLINWLENNAPYRAIARALQKGQVENLGAFERVTSGSHPAVNLRGWIIKVTSEFNKIWYVKIQSIPKFHTYGTVLLNLVPWEFWIGDQSNNKLYCGDNPEKYEELRDARKSKKRGSN